MKIIFNEELRDESSFNVDTDTTEDYLYEVIRLIDGKPLFPGEHFCRLSASLEMSGYSMSFTQDEMCLCLKKLSEVNNRLNDNVKIIVDNFGQDGRYDVIMFMMGASYPSEETYRNGAVTDFFHAVRINPHLKNRNQKLRDAANRYIAEHKVNEVILVDDNGNVTEGSRSNVFFVRGDSVYTSPSHEVLLGVTRSKIIELCVQNGIELQETVIPAESIDEFDGAFISGTSPKVLPIARIGSCIMDPDNRVIRRIMELFDLEIRKL